MAWKGGEREIGVGVGGETGRGMGIGGEMGIW